MLPVGYEIQGKNGNPQDACTSRQWESPKYEGGFPINRASHNGTPI